METTSPIKLFSLGPLKFDLENQIGNTSSEQPEPVEEKSPAKSSDWEHIDDCRKLSCCGCANAIAGFAAMLFGGLAWKAYNGDKETLGIGFAFTGAIMFSCSIGAAIGGYCGCVNAMGTTRALNRRRNPGIQVIDLSGN